MPWNGNGDHLLHPHGSLSRDGDGNGSHPHGSVSRDGNGNHPSHQSTMQVDCYNSSLLPASNENNIKQLSGIQSAFQCTSSLPTSFPPNYDAPPPIASNLIGNSAFPTSIFPLGICDKSSIASGQRETRNRRLNIVKEKRSNSVTRAKKPVNRVRNPEKILHSTIENKVRT